MDSPGIVPLAEASNPHLYGGKAATLARLLSCGISIPSGLVIPATTQWESTHWTDALWPVLKQLGAHHFAVRSSATLEDGRQHSWAGQFSTFLNVSSTDLIERIRDCVQSVHAERVRNYATLRHIDTATLRMAVLIQPMIAATVAGVAFSVDPVTRQSDQIVLEAVPGLGDTLVDGSAQPEHWLLDKKTAAVLEHQGLSSTTTTLLSTELLRLICDDVSRIEYFMQCPVDVEWAVDHEKVWILQARPITTL